MIGKNVEWKKQNNAMLNLTATFSSRTSFIHSVVVEFVRAFYVSGANDRHGDSYDIFFFLQVLQI